jgi:hypothetical protein
MNVLIINNETVSQVLAMEDCIRVQEEAFRKLPAAAPSIGRASTSIFPTVRTPVRPPTWATALQPSRPAWRLAHRCDP